MINKALKLIRVFHELSQKDLAEKLQISKSHISEIESSKKTPTLEVLYKYSKYFEIATSSIFFLSENIEMQREPEISKKVSAIIEFLISKNENIQE